jgi:hypothetical protein
MKNKLLRQLFAVSLLILLPILPLSAPVLALDDDEYGGYAADTLTIKVGYFGGPYYEKKVSRWTSCGLWTWYTPTIRL